MSRDDLVHAVALREQDIRDSYSEELCGITFEELIDMMVLDGCFLLTLFLTVAREINYKDPIFSLPWVLSSIQRDLLLLENQLPLFVLQTLLETAQFPSTIGVTTIALKFFSYSSQKPRKCRAVHKICDAKHLIDLIRKAYIPISHQTTISGLESDTNSPLTSGDSLKLTLSATKLRSSGIKFKLKTNEVVDTFLDISLDKGKLQIPELFISLLILNGIAFEQFCADFASHITSYPIFIGSLIKNGRDAALLEEEGIIQNYYGTEDEVCQFFKKITKDFAFDMEKSYLKPVFVGVNEYTANGFHVSWARFKHTYFGSPWSLSNYLIGILTVELAIVQIF